MACSPPPSSRALCLLGAALLAPGCVADAGLGDLPADRDSRGDSDGVVGDTEEPPGTDADTAEAPSDTPPSKTPPPAAPRRRSRPEPAPPAVAPASTLAEEARLVGSMWEAIDRHDTYGDHAE